MSTVCFSFQLTCLFAAKFHFRFFKSFSSFCYHPIFLAFNALHLLCLCSRKPYFSKHSKKISALEKNIESKVSMYFFYIRLILFTVIQGALVEYTVTKKSLCRCVEVFLSCLECPPPRFLCF